MGIEIRSRMKGELPFKELTHQIIGAAMEVHRELGPGFLEAVYQDALALELSSRKIPFVEHPRLELWYKQTKLRRHYEPDFLVGEQVVVELKAHTNLGPADEAQALNALKSSNRTLALLINFGQASLAWRRYANLLRPGNLSFPPATLPHMQPSAEESHPLPLDNPCNPANP